MLSLISILTTHRQTLCMSFHHIFFLKKPKTYSDGSIPIYLRFTVDGKRAETSINKVVDPAKWIAKGGRLSGHGEEVRKFNAYLDTLRVKANDAHDTIIREGNQPTAEAVKNRYTGEELKKRTLVPIFQNHNDKMKVLIPREYTESTLKKYETTLSHTTAFLKWKFKSSDIDIRLINHEFVADFDFYLRSECKCNNNTTVKYIGNFKKIVNICLDNYWLDKNPFKNYKQKIIEVDRFFLSPEQMQRVTDKVFVSARLNQVKDIFLFCCYTGLAYIDVQQLTRKDVAIGMDGEKWIFINRKKSDTPSRLPLLPFAMEILDKYKEHPQCRIQEKLLPVLSNQKMNSYLKEIADICEILEELTFHSARHTFATTITLTNGVPIESVSKMLGHRKLQTTQHYAKILDKKVSNDMNILREKFKPKLEIVRADTAVS